MWQGSLVGIPITLLQMGFHPDATTPLSVLNNFALGSAIYGADRIDAPPLDAKRFPTRVSAAYSVSYYASDAATVFLAPLVLYLHLFYAQTKPAIGPVKPFVVALLWTVCIYVEPALRGGDWDPTLAASFFLSIASISHAADIGDVEEDRRDGILTPAATMPLEGAKRYAYLLCLCSALLHVRSSSPSFLYDVAISFGTAMVLEDVVEAAVLLLLGLVFVSGNTVDLMSDVLRTTEQSHRLAISASTTGIEWSMRLPEPARTESVRLILYLLKEGDRFGSSLLSLFSDAVTGML